MTREKLFIIKLGGQVINDEALLNEALTQFRKLSGPKILVHGGGRKADEVLLAMGIKPQMIGGRRVTDEKCLEVVIMVYAGLLNKSIVAKLQQKGTDALGMTGADLNLIEAVKRPVKDIDFGFAGDIKKVNIQSLLMLLPSKVPVICSITHDNNGQLLNTNADTIAASLAVAFSGVFEVHLIYGFDKKGVLKTLVNGDEIFENINEEIFREGKLSGAFIEGIIPKLENAFDSLHKGVHSVVICHSQSIGNYGKTLFEGTVIR